MKKTMSSRGQKQSSRGQKQSASGQKLSVSGQKLSVSGQKQQAVPSDSKALKSNTVIKKVPSQDGLHKRNKHTGRYDFAALTATLPELQSHVIPGPKGGKTINFSDPDAVKMLNRALLAHHYQIKYWDIPEGFLCPPIPGRADYVHRLAELIKQDGCVTLSQVSALDIGTGANGIYPIIGAIEYDWSFTASDIDPVSVTNLSDIIENNAGLKSKVSARLQTNSAHFFRGVVKDGEKYHVTMCNPPFHKSLQEAQSGTQRKLNNLAENKAKRSGASSHIPKKPSGSVPLNFGGQKAELWCPGGEETFIKNMARESLEFSQQVLWFSTLVSKKDNVKWLCKQLEKLSAQEVQVVNMEQGNKKSRFVAWTFHDKNQRKQWWQKG